MAHELRDALGLHLRGAIGQRRSGGEQVLGRLDGVRAALGRDELFDRVRGLGERLVVASRVSRIAA